MSTAGLAHWSGARFVLSLTLCTYSAVGGSGQSLARTGEGGGGTEEGRTRRSPPAPRPSSTTVPRAAGRCAATAGGHRHRGLWMQPRGDHAVQSRPRAGGGGSRGGAT